MKYCIKTYGCQMNIHESEKLAGTLESIGYHSTEELNEADIIVFNLEYLNRFTPARKETGKFKRVHLWNCMR